MNQPEPIPWYRQFWPWFLILLPGSAVIASVATLLIAIGNADDLVVDDYARIGKLTETRIERDRRAWELGLTADATIDPDSGAVRVRIHGELEQVGRLDLHLLHPTIAARDIACALLAAPDGSFVCRLEPPGPGDRRIVLEDPDGVWRLARRVELAAGSPADLRLEAREVGQ